MGEGHGDDPDAPWVLDDAFVASAPTTAAAAHERFRRPGPQLGAMEEGALVPGGARGIEGGFTVGGSTDTVTDLPTPAPSADAPLGMPPEVPDERGYAFGQAQEDGAPVTWDPCRPIRHVVGGDAAPEGAEDLLDEAIAEVEAATGPVFEEGGATDEPVGGERRPVQRERYGDRWAPVLVAWSDEATEPMLEGDVAGVAGPQSISKVGGPRVHVTGTVVPDAPDAAATVTHEGSRDLVRLVVMHELAHLVGLDHVDDPEQLMHPRAGADVTGFDPGDRAGLARLGSRPCVPGL